MLNRPDIPLVSILIPAYKHEYFRESYYSALMQTYSNIEIIITDDSRTDHIRDIVYSSYDGRVKYEKNSMQLGPIPNHVKLINQANGEYLKFLNDDDVLSKDCIEEMVKAFSADSIKLVTSYHKLIDENGEVLPDQVVNARIFTKNMVVTGKSFATKLLKFGINYVGEPTCVMFRKNDIISIRPHPFSFGGYGKDKSGLGDVGLALNLMCQGDVAYLEMPLSKIRQSVQQWSNMSDAKQWSKVTWRQFLVYGIRSGLVSKYSLGWFLKCKSLCNNNTKYRYVFTASIKDLILQARWFIRLLRNSHIA